MKLPKVLEPLQNCGNVFRILLETDVSIRTEEANSVSQAHVFIVTGNRAGVTATVNVLNEMCVEWELVGSGDTRHPSAAHFLVKLESEEWAFKEETDDN